MRELNVFWNGIKVGILCEDDEERLEFKYSDSWIWKKDSFPLSLDLRIREEKYGHKQTKAFFENLIPEGNIKKILVEHAKNNIEDEFNFLLNFGEECAGAFVISEKKKTKPESAQTPSLKEITPAKLDKYISTNESLADVMVNIEGGHFSLAGAQDKFPVILKKGKIFLVTNDYPTSHILKPPIRIKDVTESSPYNEYFCMTLAKKVGLHVPEVELIKNKYPIYLIKRFDRKEVDGKIHRIHSFDFCQANGLTSKKKYEIDKGPTFSDHYTLVRETVSNPIEDLDQLTKWLWFNIFIGNNDCHAKNLSFVHKDENLVLSPFYDLLSTAIYSSYKQEFTYKIGGQNKWSDLKIKNVELLANECGIKTQIILHIGKIVHDKLNDVLDTHFAELYDGHNEYTYKLIEQLIRKRVSHLGSAIFNKTKN